MTTNVASVRKFFERYFPERHLYHRSRGAVQFIILSAPAQIALLALTLGFLGWVAYASVNVVFKNQIVAAKEQHFATMQAAYESRIAEMQSSLDEIHSALIKTQDRFTAAAGELEERHRELSEIFARHEAALKDLGTVKLRITQSYKSIDRTEGGNKLVAAGEEANPQAADPETGEGPQLRKATIEPDFAGGPSAPLQDRPQAQLTDAKVSEGLPQPLAAQSRSIAGHFLTLGAAQHSMVTQLDSAALQAARGLEKIVDITGLNVDRVLEQVAQDSGPSAITPLAAADNEGGPYIPLASIAGPGRRLSRQPVDQDVGHLKNSVDRLVGLESALSVIPLVAPLQVDFHVASGFGRRYDPFTGQPAFHYGLDFVAPLASPILATSAGQVTYAGRLGPYGNMIEIDHGHGVRTRYGHLYRIDVKVGDVVKFHQQIGLLGSTGRSTGPHVHYEVRFNGTLRDPARFLEAGRYVFQG